MPLYTIKITVDAPNDAAAQNLADRAKVVLTGYKRTPPWNPETEIEIVIEEYEEFDAELYDVILDSPGQKKINVIKEVRALTMLGLREAKDLVDASANRPRVILRDVSATVAKGAIIMLEEAAATAHIERSRLTQFEIDEAKQGLLDTVSFCAFMGDK